MLPSLSHRLRSLSQFSTLCIGLSICFLLLHSPFIDQVPLTAMDESWISNTAANFARGQGLINLVPGYHGGQDFYVHTALLGIFYKILGVSLSAGRIASISVGLLALFGFANILRRLNFSIPWIGIISLIWMGNTVHFIIFRWVRPEAVVACALTWCLYALIVGLQDQRREAFLGSGICAGAAAMSHPQGVLLAFPIGVATAAISLWKRRPRDLIFFVLGVAVVFGITLINIHHKNHSILSFLQLKMADNRTVLQFGSFAEFLGYNTKRFFEIYSLGHRRILVVIIEALVIFPGLFRFRDKPIQFWMSVLSLTTFGLGITLLFPFRRRYAAVFLLPTLICLAFVVHRLWSRKGRSAALAVIILLLYGGNNLAGDAFLWIKGYQNTPYDTIQTWFKSHIPKGSWVVANQQFWIALSHTDMLVRDNYGRRELKRRDFVILTDEFTKAISPTTGLVENNFGEQEREARYQPYLNRLVPTLADKVASLETRGYGTITIWKIRKD